MGAKQIVRVVIDTNVLASAALFGGTPGRLVALWQTGLIRPYASRPIVAEYLRVLAYPRFELTQAEIEYLLYGQILPYFGLVDPSPGPAVISEDSADDAFLHCAGDAMAQAIISGDRHLPNLGTYQNIPLLTVAQFLQSPMLLNV